MDSLIIKQTANHFNSTAQKKPIMKQTTPQVFISHASDDKERFVINFALKLRQNGVDAWLDEWEIRPGDSPVDKIFEGIKNADTIIIVLSQASIVKPWVKEELNASTIKKNWKRCSANPHTDWWLWSTWTAENITLGTDKRHVKLSSKFWQDIGCNF